MIASSVGRELAFFGQVLFFSKGAVIDSGERFHFSTDLSCRPRDRTVDLLVLRLHSLAV